MRHRRRRDERSRKLRHIVVISGFALLLVLLYIAGMQIEKSQRKPETEGDYRQRYETETLVEYGGEKYRPRPNLKTLLFMGVDRSENSESNGYRNGGQADFLRLVVIDAANKKVSQVQIDRDTMTPITILGVLGNRSGVRTAQVCLSHGFGDGGVQSCELTVEAVSNLFFDLPIDYYVSVNMDGISALNELVGGVEVTLEDDFSAFDPEMVQGATLTLTGEQAETFVRGRRNVGVGTNEARMVRQEAYLSALTERINVLQTENKNFIGKLYDGVNDYMTTDVSRGLAINLAWSVREYEREALIRPSGSYAVGADGFAEFHVDEEELQKLVLELCYQKVD